MDTTVIFEAMPQKKRPGRPKDPQSKRSQGVDRHVKPRTVVHFPEDFHAAIRELAKRNHRTITAEIYIAVEEHLRASGVWPPPSPK